LGGGGRGEGLNEAQAHLQKQVRIGKGKKATWKIRKKIPGNPKKAKIKKKKKKQKKKEAQRSGRGP